MTQTSPGLGHVHLKVADLDRAIAFWTDVMGMTLMQHYGEQAAFVSWDGYHHHVGLNTWSSRGGTQPPAGHTGLFHAAFLYPDRKALVRAARRVRDAGHTLYGHADHGVSVAVYFDDPDGNGIELYYDKPREAWPFRPDGTLAMTNDGFDLAAFLAEDP